MGPAVPPGEPPLTVAEQRRREAFHAGASLGQVLLDGQFGRYPAARAAWDYTTGRERLCALLGRVPPPIEVLALEASLPLSLVPLGPHPLPPISDGQLQHAANVVLGWGAGGEFLLRCSEEVAARILADEAPTARPDAIANFGAVAVELLKVARSRTPSVEVLLARNLLVLLGLLPPSAALAEGGIHLGGADSA